MNRREIWIHKFKLIFLYNNNSDSKFEDIFYTYILNLPYETEEDDNSYLSNQKNNVTKIYKDIDSENIFIDEDDNERELFIFFKNFIDLSSQIDDKIKNSILDYDIDRLNKIDLALLRLATYEIYYDNNTEYKLAINEVIDISKVYSEEKSPKFINGVISSIMNKYPIL